MLFIKPFENGKQNPTKQKHFVCSAYVRNF